MVGLSYFLLGPFMLPAIMSWFWLWIPIMFWFNLQPEDFVDTDGKVLPGFPTLVARTRDMLKMLLFDPIPFLSNPEAEDLTLEFSDFVMGYIHIMVYWVIAWISD